MTHHDLLRQYVDHGSEDAFTELVRRHLAIVYSSALRQMRDAHQAEDVTQAVFTSFARCAGRIGPKTLISGWLLTATRYIASNARKSAARRHFHESKAAWEKPVMENTADPLWEELSPHLDEALGELRPANRDALVLRYFEGKSVRETALALGISEDAAKQRVSRALEQLREIFSRRGIAVPAAAVGVLLAVNAAQAVPSALPGVLAASAIEGAKSLAMHQGAIAIAAALKAKFAAAILLLVTLAAATTVAMHYAVEDAAPARPVVPVQQVQDVQPDWHKAFNAAYRLDKDQVIKLVQEPFIPERAQVFKGIDPRMIDLTVPNICTFVDNDGEISFQTWRRSKPSLRAVLQQLGFPSYQVELADEDQDVYVYGDWVYRPGATLDQKIDDLNVILREQIAWKRTFKKSEAARPVYIVTGAYHQKPIIRGKAQMVELYIDQKKRVLGNNAGNVGSFLVALGEMMNTEFIDETHSSREGLFWQNYIGETIPPAMVGKVLENLHRQMGLDFTPGERKTVHYISTGDRP